MRALWAWLKSKLKKGSVNSEPLPTNEVPVPIDYSNDAALLASIVVKPEMMDELNAEVAHANANRERYEVVSSQTGVPWKAIKAIHYREASNSFKTCLHNGDPLPGPTKHVPKGRGPFNSWETAAVDALLLEKAKFPAVWDLAGTLDFLEKYNGLGYRNHGMVSPYNYAGTTAYVAGLYTDDGVLDKNKVDHRLGCAAILKGLS